MLYENEAAIGLIVFRAFLSCEEIVELNKQLIEQSPEERALAQFNALSNEDQAETIKIGQHLWMGFLVGFFQNVFVMVHGEKLTSLVAQAKAGV